MILTAAFNISGAQAQTPDSVNIIDHAAAFDQSAKTVAEREPVRDMLRSSAGSTAIKAIASRKCLERAGYRH